MTTHADSAIEAASETLIALSHSIHAEPELAFEEYRSAAKIVDVLRGCGFEVRTGVADLPTAFDARFGSGDLVLAFCAEYDALPGIGHACGHNIIAAAAVGAGHRVWPPLADELGITVRVIGTPAEETGGGKVLMLERGVFDDVGAAMMVHPGPIDITGATSLALADIAVDYTGREAHASAAPEYGRNAADAATVAQVARRPAASAPAARASRSTESSATAAPPPTSCPATPSCSTTCARPRPNCSTTSAGVRRAVSRPARSRPGCTHEIRTVSPTYTELTPDPWLVQAYREEIDRARPRAVARRRWKRRVRWAAPTWET